MRPLTHIPASNRHVADVGHVRPAPPPTDDPACDGSSQPCAPAALVRIYEMEKEWNWHFWLCPAGAAQMVRERWTIRKHRAPPFDGLPCEVHATGPCPR